MDNGKLIAQALRRVAEKQDAADAGIGPFRASERFDICAGDDELGGEAADCGPVGVTGAARSSLRPRWEEET